MKSIKGLSTLVIIVIALILAIVIGFLIVSGSAFQLQRGAGIGTSLTCSQALASMCASFREQTNGLYDPSLYPFVYGSFKGDIEKVCKREEINCQIGTPGCIVNLNDVGSVIVYCCGRVGGDPLRCRISQNQTNQQGQTQGQSQQSISDLCEDECIEEGYREGTCRVGSCQSGEISLGRGPCELQGTVCCCRRA